MHKCRVCGHRYESFDLETARKVRQAEAANKNGPVCSLCLHLAMAHRHARLRGFINLRQVVSWWSKIRSVNKL